MHTDMHIYVYAYIQTYIYMYMYVRMYAYTYIHTYVCIHMYSYTHVCTRSAVYSPVHTCNRRACIYMQQAPSTPRLATYVCMYINTLKRSTVPGPRDPECMYVYTFRHLYLYVCNRRAERVGACSARACSARRSIPGVSRRSIRHGVPRSFRN